MPSSRNVLRILDIPQAVAMVSEHCRVELNDVDPGDWSEAVQVAKRFGWDKNLVINRTEAAPR